VAWQFEFETDRFAIEDGEEESTNPGCYGKALAKWLGERLVAAGYQADVVAEDWGWCVMCARADYLLWVGCGNVDEAEALGGEVRILPEPLKPTAWRVFVESEIPFFMVGSLVKKWLGLLDIQTPRDELGAHVERILASNGLLAPRAKAEQ
jgi:hypothetical protein